MAGNLMQSTMKFIFIHSFTHLFIKYVLIGHEPQTRHE